MNFELTELQEQIRDSVRQLCSKFDLDYWRKLDDKNEYPDAFLKALTEAGWLSVVIPKEYGGAGLGISEACVVLEEIEHTGAEGDTPQAAAYTMASILNHGTEDQKQKYLPQIANGSLRLVAFGITEPGVGSDTTKITTFAKRDGDGYTINGQKVFISRFKHSDLMLLLARTTPLNEVKKKSDGLTLFLVDLREVGDSIKATPIELMFNVETFQLFIENLHVPSDAVIGEVGKGFRYMLENANAERIISASRKIGSGRWLVERAVKYANERVIFDRPIGSNQGVQFPIAKAYMSLEAASLMRWKAATLLDAGKPAGDVGNIAKYLASEAFLEAADVTMRTFGGYGSAKDFYVERKWRECIHGTVAPVSNNLVLAYIGNHVLGMPRSY